MTNSIRVTFHATHTAAPHDLVKSLQSMDSTRINIAPTSVSAHVPADVAIGQLQDAAADAGFYRADIGPRCMRCGDSGVVPLDTGPGDAPCGCREGVGV